MFFTRNNAYLVLLLQAHDHVKWSSWHDNVSVGQLLGYANDNEDDSQC